MKRKTNIYLTNEMIDALKAEAKLQGLPYSEIIRQIVGKWMQDAARA